MVQEDTPDVWTAELDGAHHGGETGLSRIAEDRGDGGGGEGFVDEEKSELCRVCLEQGGTVAKDMQRVWRVGWKLSGRVGRGVWSERGEELGDQSTLGLCKMYECL